MEQETLFTAIKWDILQALSAGRKSPLELSEQNKTSVSNVSQSLRFLELAGLVKSERISNRDKGLPRVIYSLNGERVYLVVVSNGFASKGFVELDRYRKAILRIWLFPEKQLQPLLENSFAQIKDELGNYSKIGLDKKSLPDINLLAVQKSLGKGKREIKELSVSRNGIYRKIKLTKVSEQDLQKLDCYLIYDEIS